MKFKTLLISCLVFLFSNTLFSQDIIPPQARCKVGFVLVLPVSGTITINARDFDDGSTDNVTASEDLEFYLNHNRNYTTYTVNCDTFDNHGVLGTLIQEFFLSIRDEAGNISQCVVRLEVQDNKSICGNPILSCNGVFYNWANRMQVLADTSCASGILTDSYTVVLDTVKEVSICRNSDPTNGVSTADIVTIQRHLLGKKEFDHPLDYFAADANNSNSVTAGDLSTLRKVVLGTVVDFTQWGHNSWVFYVDDGFYNDSSLVKGPRKKLVFDDLSNCPSYVDFVGLKIGDLTGDAVNGFDDIKTRSNPSIKIKASYSRKTESLEFYLEEEIELAAVQFALSGLHTHMTFNDIISGQLNINENHIYCINNEFRLSWNTEDGEGIILETDRPLFSIRLAEAEIVSIHESDYRMKSMAFNVDLNPIDLIFQFNEDYQEFIVSQNAPNPFDKTTTISIFSPGKENAEIVIYDQYGHVVYSKNTGFSEGRNALILNENDLPISGVYYFQLNGLDGPQIKKIIKL